MYYIQGSGEELRWSSVTKGCPSGSIAGPVLFNVSINDKDSGVEGTLSTLADDPELSSAGDTPGRQDAIQGTWTCSRSGPMGISGGPRRPNTMS